MIVPAMAMAGSLAGKKSIPPSAGTFPTTGGLFVGLVVGVILIIGGLTFFPALALGPIVEHLAGERQHPVLIESHFGVTSMEVVKTEQADAGIGDARSEDRDARDRLGLRQARSAADDQEPGDVRGRGRRRADHGDLPARSGDGRRRASASPSRSSCGCGSRCCSPISPKPSPKAAARRRPKSLRKTRTESQAKLLTGSDKSYRLVSGTSLKVGDVVLVEAGDIIPVRRRGDRGRRLGRTKPRSPASPRR